MGGGQRKGQAANGGNGPPRPPPLGAGPVHLHEKSIHNICMVCARVLPTVYCCFLRVVMYLQSNNFVRSMYVVLLLTG